MKSSRIITTVLLLALVSVVTTEASATSRIGAKLGVTASTTIKTTNVSKIIARADQEIDRRVKALTDLATKVQELKKVSAAVKTSISTKVQAEVTSLNTLKAKIDAETDPVILKADAKTITDSYRIFALVIPQGRILVAADRISTVVDTVTGITVKLQAKIAQADSQGKDTVAIKAALTDLQAKTTDAQIQATAAQVHVADLTPDNGDKTKAQANKDALMKARADIKVGMQDLQAARKDIGTISKALKGFGITTGVTASSTVTVTP